MQNIDSDLIRGNIDTIILKTMLKEDKYGLDIIKEVSDKSSGTYELKQPTLYSCLKRLENQELISSYWVDSEIGGKRHYYKLTDKGRDFYNKKQEEWAKSKFIIDNLLSNYDYEEYRLVKKDDYDEIVKSQANAPLSTANQAENVQESNQENTSEDKFSNLEEFKVSNDEENADALSENEDDDNQSAELTENENNQGFDDINNKDDEDIITNEDFDSETTNDENDVIDHLSAEEQYNKLFGNSKSKFSDKHEEKPFNYSNYNHLSNDNEIKNECESFSSNNEDDDEIDENLDFDISDAEEIETEKNSDDELVFDDNNDTEIENNESDDTSFDEPNSADDETSDETFADDSYHYNNHSNFETNDEDNLDTQITDNIYNDNDEVFDLGNPQTNDDFDDNEDDDNISNSADEEDYPVYFSAKNPENHNSENNENETSANVSYETADQSSNELNILSKLRGQDDDEINTYYGDQKSYVNHLNQIDDSKLEQQDLLDSSLYVKPDLVNESIDEFSSAVNKLNNFNSSSQDTEETQNEDEITNNDASENETIVNNPTFENDSYELSDDDDDLKELDSLKHISSDGFFNSSDRTEYDKSQPTNQKNDYEFDYNQTDSSDASFENDYEPENTSSFEETSRQIEPQNYSTSFLENRNNQNTDENEYSSSNVKDYNIYENNFSNNNDNSEATTQSSEENMNDIDQIISNNISSAYVEPSTHMFTSNSKLNYREKLSDLSKYSKVTLDDEKPTEPNEDALEKAKDIAEITKELEEEGIKVKEHYKMTNAKKLDKNYLLANKINLMKSLIVFLGYVFILSAVYIVLNNTPLSSNSWFGIKGFLIGFIPFGIATAYYAIKFAINPYKKIDARYHARIMLFISIIITVQLLLITYCVNLQLGFYSFAQQEYNHLYWIIPTIISFAPIVDNLVYLALFKSRNFNV